MKNKHFLNKSRSSSEDVVQLRHKQVDQDRRGSSANMLIDKVSERMSYDRALSEIMSGPEIWEIFKIWTVRKPDVFLPGRRTFNTLKTEKKI